MKSKPFLHNPTLFILYTLTTLLLISLSTSQTPTAIQLRFETEIEITSNAPAFFQLAPQTYSADSSYLSVSALSDKNCTPILAVSKTTQNPTKKENSDYYFGGEPSKAILFIPTENLKDQNVYIGVSSDIQCSVTVTVEEAYNFKVTPDIDEYYSVYELQPNDLREKTSVVLSIDVPDIPDPDRILLHLNGVNLDQRNKPYLDVFVKKGDQAPDSSNYDQVSMRQWFEGVTVLIYKDSPAFCTNCRITVSMKIEENAFLQIHVGVLHNLLNLRAYAIIDGLETGKQNTYVATFNADSKDSNLRISINPIQGNFTVYMNCDSKPDSLSDFKWNFTIDSFESILLTPREHSNCETSTYYLVLTGNSGDNAFYSIAAQQRFNNKLFMEKDVGNLGDIVPDEPVIYDVFVPVYAAEKITLTLITQGNIDINIKNCRYASDCPDLLPPSRDIWEILNEVVGTIWPEEFKMEVMDTGYGKKVTIDPHKNGCVPFMMRDNYQGNIPLPVCAYKIELKSNETAQYNLIADLEGHNLILPGYPIEGAVLVNDQQYYVLYAPYDDLKSVAIQLTTLSGDIDLFVSNTTLFPSEENDTTRFSHGGLVLYTNTTSLNGTYYITVKGHQTSSYILTATLITQDGREEDYSVRLHEGIPQKGVLLPRHEHPMLFYSINVFFDNEWEGSLKITINPNHGNLAMTVSSNGQIPQPNFNQWQSTQHELTILSTDRFFNRRGIYYIGIYPDPDDSSTLSYDEITFNIVYSFQTTGKGEDINKELEYLTPLNANHILLSSDSTFEGRINKGEIRFFKFNAYSSDDTVTVSLQSSSDSVALFASTNTSQPHPGPDNYAFTTKDTYRNYITITRDDLKKTCFGDVQEVVTCPIYLSVITTTGDELPFVLDIARGVAQNGTSRTPLTQLSTGKERLFKVPADNQFIYFYFFTLPGLESLITVTARHHDIEIYAKIADIPLGQDINTYFGDIEAMDYPESSGQKEMTMTSYSNLRVPALASTNPIVVLAKLRFKAHQGEAFDYSSQPTFSIIASNVVTHIFPGKVYNSESYDDDTYQYYSFYVPDPEQSFKVTLTSLSDANQDMYLTYSKFARPTKARHDFYSASSPRVEELSVTPLDIYPRKLMNGTWVIGVYAENKGQYSLLVTFGNQVVQLVESSPIEEYLPENSKAYFSYYNDHATDLYIKLGKMSGNPVLYINSLQPGASVQDNIPNKGNYTWMFKPSRQAATTAIKTTDPKYCSHCLYVMTVETDEQVSKFSLIVLEKGHWELAQNDVTYSDTVSSQDTKGYFFITSSAAGASLNIKVLTGKLNAYTSHNPTANTTNYIDKVQVETSDRYKELNMSQDYLNGHPDQAEIFDGSRDVASDPWGYYVILENLESTDVTYTILFRDIGSEQTLITANIRQHLVVGKEGEQDVLFYSSSKGGLIKASIEYTLPASAQDDELGFSGLYWSEKAITGLGKSVDIRKDDVNVDKVRDGVKYMRKNVEIKSEVGKYQFTIENPTQEVISFSILVYPAQDVSFVSLESNSYHFSRLREDQTETFEVYLPGAGSWYLEMNQCSGKLRIAIADSTDDLTNVNNLFIPNSDSFLHKLYSKNAGSKYIRVFAEEADDEDGASFLLRNFYFKEDSLINFDKATAGQVAELSSQYNSQNNTLPVSFEPISFAGSKKEDFVLYKVVACQDAGLARTIALCDMRPLDEATGENCQFDEFSQDLSQPLTGQTSLDLAPGDYHLYIVGNIVHNGEMVHSVTYPPATVTLKGHSGVTFDQVKSYLPYIGAGVGLLVALVVGFAVYAKYKKKKEVRRQTEMENFRRRGYGIMQEEF